MERKWGWHIIGGMKRHTPWIQLVAVVLMVVGLVTLAAPAPAHAMDPQLMLALASAAGAIALIVGYLIVANGRERQRGATLEGIYACGDQEASGPMGCGTPAASVPMAVAAAPESPMAVDARSALRTDSRSVLAQVCPGRQVAGPMGCGGSIGPEPGSAAPAPTAAPQGQ